MMAQALRLEDIEEFEAMRRVPPQAITPEIIQGIRGLNERTEIEPFLTQILADFDRTAHNSTEIADVLTTKVTYYGKTLFTAFVCKGKSSAKVKAKEVSHQLLRLRSVPNLDLIVLLAAGDIQDDVKRDLSQVASDADAYFMIADAGDMARLLIAHGKVCPEEGSPYESGLCTKCGRNEAEPIELIWRVREEPAYTVIEHEDVSHALAKRFSDRIVTDHHYTKPIIRQIIKKAVESMRTSTYTRSLMVEQHFGDRPADCILLFVFLSVDDEKENNWVCKATWNSPDLSDDCKWNNSTDADERIGDIKVDWNSSYHALKDLLREGRVSKGHYVRGVEPLLSAIVNLDNSGRACLQAYQDGDMASEQFETEMAQLEGVAAKLDDDLDSIGLPPFECAEADKALQTYVMAVHNIFVAFAHWSCVERDMKGKLDLAMLALYDIDAVAKRFESEWCKLRQ